jgi:hypothetical protein
MTPYKCPLSEGFSDTAITTIPAEVESKYKQFIDFYTKFCPAWQNAMQSSVALDTPQQPLTSPSQVKDIQQQQQQTPQDMQQENQYIQKLSLQLGKPLPNICTATFPSDALSAQSNQVLKAELVSLKEIAETLPSDAQPYINALDWMNTQMEKSHGNLDKALTGNFLKTNEGFVSEQCKQVLQCEDESQKETTQIYVETIKKKLDAFFTNKDVVQQSLQKNQQLIEKSKDIQRQAQSGELIKKVNIPDAHYYAPVQMPPGSNNLQQMKENNPQQYNNYKQNYSQWYQIKSLNEQINNSLSN